MSDPQRVTPPTGAWDPGHQALAPNGGHAAVLVASIALAAALIAASTAVSGNGLIALLVLLLGCGALVVPVAVMVATWARARHPVRVLFAMAGLACLLLLVFAVVRIAAIVPMLA